MHALGLRRRGPACLTVSSLSSLFPLPSPSSCPPAPPPSAFPEAEQTDLRPQEPHLRLRHGLHHKRHADRGQPDPAERHGVAAPPLTALRSQLTAHVHALRADSVPPQKRKRTWQTWRTWRTWHSSAKNPRLRCNRCCRSTSSPWQGHKRAVFNALMVLFPNAIK